MSVSQGREWPSSKPEFKYYNITNTGAWFALWFAILMILGGITGMRWDWIAFCIIGASLHYASIVKRNKRYWVRVNEAGLTIHQEAEEETFTWPEIRSLRRLDNGNLLNVGRVVLSLFSVREVTFRLDKDGEEMINRILIEQHWETGEPFLADFTDEDWEEYD